MGRVSGVSHTNPLIYLDFDTSGVIVRVDALERNNENGIGMHLLDHYQQPCGSPYHLLSVTAETDTTNTEVIAAWRDRVADASINTMPIEGNQLRSQLADFFDEVLDQLSLRSRPGVGCSPPSGCRLATDVPMRAIL